ncbi:RCC1 domain-containing protein [Arthrobacter sp. H-02-3]|uniref:RCC1 domain-containing protein n=1 Tax=Arthrobacter sp. H-02-3 TaxID=2703675 RepID=UPI000DD1E04A|nr:cutinase family protein [Arthrobacter sp. H-02-3]PVZ52353.1 hypothetical protein C9424_20485 [Arthrobacter sp. H-02-3]
MFNRRFRPILSALTIVLVSTSIAGTPGVAIAATPAVPCGDINLIGLAGSGELDSPASAGPDNLGSVVGSLADKLVNLYSGSTTTVTKHGVPYQAVSVIGALQFFPNYDPFIYQRSETDGVSNLLKYLADFRNSGCKGAIVLGGYSQGADAVVDTYLSLPASFRRQVASVVLFGDPRFRPADVVDQEPYNHAGHGILGIRTTPLDTDLPTVDRFPAKTASFCLNEDPVCGATTVPATVSELNDCRQSGLFCAHKNYAGTSTDKGSRFAAKLREAVNIATGQYSATTYALKSDGTVWAWGSNRYGQLGTGTTTSSLFPVLVKGLTGVKAIATDGFRTFAIKTDGTVLAWGENNGQLGIGTTAIATKPVQVKGLSSVQSIAISSNATYALKTDGTVWAWGANFYGQLGNGTKTTSLSPVQVKGLSNIKRLSPTFESAYALKTDGTVWAWGDNSGGLLGTGTGTDSTTPAQVHGVSGVGDIAAGGGGEAYAVKTDGTLWAWGGNAFGQLGNGTKTTSTSPVRVAGVAGVQKVIADGYSTFAIKTDGTVWAWGGNFHGQLGTGSIASGVPTPAPIPGLGGVKDVIIAGYAAHAVKIDGTEWGWGSNFNGELGSGTSGADRPSPVQVKGLTSAKQAAADGSSAFALKKNGTVWAWGYNGAGALGNRSTTSSSVPVQVG